MRSLSTSADALRGEKPDAALSDAGAAAALGVSAPAPDAACSPCSPPPPPPAPSHHPLPRPPPARRACRTRPLGAPPGQRHSTRPARRACAAPPARPCARAPSTRRHPPRATPRHSTTTCSLGATPWHTRTPGGGTGCALRVSLPDGWRARKIVACSAARTLSAFLCRAAAAPLDSCGSGKPYASAAAIARRGAPPPRSSAQRCTLEYSQSLLWFAGVFCWPRPEGVAPSPASLSPVAQEQSVASGVVGLGRRPEPPRGGRPPVPGSGSARLSFAGNERAAAP